MSAEPRLTRKDWPVRAFSGCARGGAEARVAPGAGRLDRVDLASSKCVSL